MTLVLEQLLDRLAPELERLSAGQHADPAAVLGAHPHGARTLVLVLLPGAVRARLNRRRDLVRIGDTALFAWYGRPDGLRAPYPLSWQGADGALHATHDPYSFPLLSLAGALTRFNAGTATDAAQLFGAHPERHADVDGVRFALYAPRAQSVALLLNRARWPMRPLAEGAWELFLPGVPLDTRYRFEVLSAKGAPLVKTDPFGRLFERRPRRAARVCATTSYHWHDADWLRNRRGANSVRQALSIYELHVGSWRTLPRALAGYRALAPLLAEHVLALGFTHVELLPLTEHPHDGSWGYQTTGYFAPTSRFGSPDDFRFFVDHLHSRGIGVLLDWVPGHFASDAHALARFDGTPVYEYADPRRGEHRAWGTRVFDFSRPQVCSFLLSSARYWLEEFHIDGLRVDAVAAMLYLDYERAPGEWLPNAAGGREHEAAIEFLRELNGLVHREFPGTLTCAEESSGWPGVTHPTTAGGLGFDLVWDMGWMHDTLAFLGEDPVFRRHHHQRLIDTARPRRSERRLLPLSHDEVVHGKRSLLGRMPGDAWQKFANLRLLLAWQWTCPGRKLLFMGGEFAQHAEWSHERGLDWPLSAEPAHAGVLALLSDLNRLYRDAAPFHGDEDDSATLAWLERDDALRSVIVFERRTGAAIAVVAFNFTPVPRIGFRLGLARAGAWREVLNTDAACYGGSDVGNLGQVIAERDPAMGQPYSANVTLPPLAAVVLMPATA